MKVLKQISTVLLFSCIQNTLYASDVVNFVVMGDMPYTQKDKETLKVLETAIPALAPKVLIHYGDLMSGAESCTEALLSTRKEQIYSFLPRHAVYTPGDNEWVDCDRKHLTSRYAELERLDYLRNLFYEDEAMDLSADIDKIVRQKGQPANSMWKIGNLLMGTLHIVGTNNGRVNILKNDVNKTLDEVDKRDANNLVWLKKLFDNAKNAEGLVVVFHADIYRFKGDAEACTKENRLKCNPYKNIREALKYLALDYKKPVLVVHGDTHPYCFNQPYSEKVPNFWHLNGPGDFKVSDAAHIIFNVKNKERPFEVRGVLHPERPPLVCNYNRSK